MERLDDILELLDYTLNTKKRRHAIGGALLSISLLFGGLALQFINFQLILHHESNRRRNY